MANKGISKVQHIRNMLEAHPDMRPKDIITALAARKIKVSSAQVSNVRAFKPKKKGGRPAKTNGELLPTIVPSVIAPDKLAFATVLFLAKCGSAAKAREAIKACDDMDILGQLKGALS